jgi:mannose-1-phosphate guanylyltransferase / mannose-6-phosphate isomerase
LRERGVEADIVLEPMRRHSGLAVMVAAVLAAERATAIALVLVLAADHVIPQARRIPRSCRSAALAAAEGRIVTFGIEPTGPVTSYGYIHPGKKLNGASVRGRRLCREARCCHRSNVCRRSLSLEQRQFPVSRRDDAE